MSHSAISTFIDSRSGLSVTRRYTCEADSSTPRSRSSGISSVVFHIWWAAISRRRFQWKSSFRRAITATPPACGIPAEGGLDGPVQRRPQRPVAEV